MVDKEVKALNLDVFSLGCAIVGAVSDTWADAATRQRHSPSKSGRRSRSHSPEPFTPGNRSATSSPTPSETSHSGFFPSQETVTHTIPSRLNSGLSQRGNRGSQQSLSPGLSTASSFHSNVTFSGPYDAMSTRSRKSAKDSNTVRSPTSRFMLPGFRNRVVSGTSNAGLLQCVMLELYLLVDKGVEAHLSRH